LEHSGQTVCVLTLYRNQKDAFAALVKSSLNRELNGVGRHA
jgi:hypothetical protein